MAAHNFLPDDDNEVEMAQDYRLRYLAFHLHAAAQFDRLHHMLTSSATWMEKKYSFFGDDTLFLEDLTLALRDLVDPLDSRQILTAVQLHAARHLARERESHYEDLDIEILVFLGRRKEAERHVRLRHMDTRFYLGKFSGLLALCRALREMRQSDPLLLEEALYTLRDVSDFETSQRGLHDLAIEFSALGNLPNALMCARSISRDAVRVSALALTAVELLQLQRHDDARPLADEAIAAVAALNDPVEFSKTIVATADLLRNLNAPEKQAMWITYAHQKVLDIPSGNARSDALTKLVIAYIKLELLPQATSVLSEIADRHDRASALIEFALVLNGLNHTDTARATLLEARMLLEGVS